MFFDLHFTRIRGGMVKVRLSDAERALIAALPEQLEGLIRSEGATGTERLFPSAYGTDAARNAEYERLMRSELVDRRIESLGVFRDTLSRDKLTVEELDAWVRVLNDARLVLGTLLDVSEDEDPYDGDPTAPNAHQRMAYVTLSAIVSDAVEALSGALPGG